MGGEGSDRPIFANSETAAVLESLEGRFYGLTWWSDRKVSKTYFLGQNWPQKSQNCPKSISREPLYKVSYPLKMTARHRLLSVVWDVYTPQTTGSSLKILFFCFFLGLIMTKMYDFTYLVNHWSCKVGWSPQEWIYFECCKICILLRQREVPKNAFVCGFIKWNFKSFHITRTIYHIKLADLAQWPKEPSFY